MRAVEKKREWWKRETRDREEATTMNLSEKIRIAKEDLPYEGTLGYGLGVVIDMLEDIEKRLEDIERRLVEKGGD